MAEQFRGEAKSISELEQMLIDADVFISSTGSRHFVVTKEMIAQALKKRKGRPLFMVDIAVPRDLDPNIADYDNVYLYDIDDLQHIVESNLAERKQEAEKIELMIEKELADFAQWLNTLGVVPIITALRTKALNVQADTMESIERKLPNLSEREKKVLRKHTKSIVNQLLRDPITRVKELAGEDDADQALELFTKIFALEEELASLEEEERIVKLEKQWEESKKEYVTLATKRKAVVRS